MADLFVERMAKSKAQEEDGSSENGQLDTEVLQLCRYPVIGWPDASPGLFGLRSIQVAPV